MKDKGNVMEENKEILNNQSDTEMVSQSEPINPINTEIPSSTNVDGTSESISSVNNLGLENQEQATATSSEQANDSLNMDSTSKEDNIDTQKRVESVEQNEVQTQEVKETPSKKEKKRKQKDGGSGYGCASFLFLIILCLIAYILFDKGIVTYDKLNSEFHFVGLKALEEKEVVEQEEEKDDTLYYVSEDGRYFLMLGHENKYLQSSSGNQSYFVLEINDSDSRNVVTGGYQIKNGELTLVVISGCQSDNKTFTCSLPNGVEVSNVAGTNMITLPYMEERVTLGNIALINEENIEE